ncbi:NUDIX hydrolase [Ignisphaera aggregans DSM 17230]|uniref:NUDIX hydrolase n=1 Tax=Ignisphaera aggregans (strain DSM 17230 / JCM 13409 / AQ1.S1) TaxID=583356 RepID=E0SS30_IGNAA|nr:NUDIX hydrolase [Ignisphaera aggregans DSM 17230]
MDREYPEYAIAAVGAVLIKDGMILLIKRGYPPREGFWAIPGGAIEAGETIYDAAKRELEEETGLLAEPLGVIAISQAIFRENYRIRFHYIIIDVLFNQDTIKGSLKPGGDAIDVAWIPLEEVLSRDDVTITTKRLVRNIVEKGIKVIDIV